MTDTNLFDDDNSSTPSKYASWTLEDLVKKAEAADIHINTIEHENRLYKEANETTNKLDELLEKLDPANNSSLNYQNPPVNNSGNHSGNTSEVVTKEQVLDMVSKALENNQKVNQAKNNVATVEKKLKETWGENYKKNLNERAANLNVAKEFLMGVAESYPEAFLKLVLEDNKPSTNYFTPPTSTRTPVNPLNATAPMNSYKDFSKLMKDNPSLRHDASFQAQLHAAAEKIGPAFFN